MTSCGMCDMLAGPPNGQIIYSSKNVCAIIKYGKRSKHTPIEFMIVPKHHYENLQSPGAETIVGEMTSLLQYLAGVDGEYQLVCNNGKTAGQTLFHLHWHICSHQTMWPLLAKHLGSRSLDWIKG